MIQGQRSMRGVRMNTLGWFDFKSAWFAPPDPLIALPAGAEALFRQFTKSLHYRRSQQGC